MKIIHNIEDGSLKLKFSFKEILVMIFKNGLFLNKTDLRNFHGYTAHAVLKNIENKQYDDKK